MATDSLTRALERFVNAEDWDEARSVVEENENLLSEQAQRVLAENIADYRLAERDDVADYLEQHRAILERSGEVGIGSAFEEAEAQARGRREARQAQLAPLRPADPTPLQATVWRLLDADSPEEVDQVLSEHPKLSREEEALSYLDDLMQQADRAGSTEALSFLREYHELLRTFYELPPLMRALQEFISVPTWGESREALKSNPELMSPEATQVLDTLIQEATAQGDEPTTQALQAYRQVLERSREVGPDQAIDEVIQREQPSPAS